MRSIDAEPHKPTRGQQGDKRADHEQAGPVQLPQQHDPDSGAAQATSCSRGFAMRVRRRVVEDGCGIRVFNHHVEPLPQALPDRMSSGPPWFCTTKMAGFGDALGIRQNTVDAFHSTRSTYKTGASSPGAPLDLRLRSIWCAFAAHCHAAELDPSHGAAAPLSSPKNEGPRCANTPALLSEAEPGALDSNTRTWDASARWSIRQRLG